MRGFSLAQLTLKQQYYGHSDLILSTKLTITSAQPP